MGKRQVAPPRPVGLAVAVLDDDIAIFSWDAGVPAEATLTAAERDVLARVAAGATNEEIARARKSSPRTIANQVASLLRKLNAASRYELIGRYGTSAP